MSDDLVKNKTTSKSWLEKIKYAITKEPQTKADIIEMLKNSVNNNILDTDSLRMLEGVLEVNEIKVKDVMIPRSQMETIPYSMDLEQIVKIVVESGHSRFPIIGENKDEVLGILLAKDLLNYAFGDKKFNLKDILRNADFIPEGKRLNSLLQEFRIKRSHMAIVVDEYGGITGLITIEDVIEQIIGEIEDEHDIVESPFIKKHMDNTYSIKAITSIDEFNEYFQTNFYEPEIETIGGLLLKKFGHMPKKDEEIQIDEFKFKILQANKRQVFSIKVIPKNSL